MERIQSINPDRIAWCCAENGITPNDLAQELGIATTSIDKVMTGKDGITFNQLQKIADFFGKGVLFFMEKGEIDNTKVNSPQFRTIANQKTQLTLKVKTLIQRVEKHRNIYLSLREDLDNDLSLSFNPPKLSNHNLHEAAEITRRWLNLTNESKFDAYRSAIEAKGILVFRSNGYNGKWQIAKENPILGFTLFYPVCPVIFVKKQKWETRQTFTLIHELAHILLHKTSFIDDEQDFQTHRGKEREANVFTGILLVPDSVLATINDSEKPNDTARFDEWLEQPKRATGASVEVILLRLLDVGRISQDEYSGYKQWWSQQSFLQNEETGSRAYRYREPVHIFGKNVVSTVLEALNARQITLAKASSYLDNLKIRDLHQLERHFANL